MIQTCKGSLFYVLVLDFLCFSILLCRLLEIAHLGESCICVTQLLMKITCTASDIEKCSDKTKSVGLRVFYNHETNRTREF